jgi:hypothetical protein
MTVPPPRSASPAWRRVFRFNYAILRRIDPLVAAWWRLFGIGITCRLTVRGRRTGRRRSLLLGLMTVDRHAYVGHPNGDVAWTLNLAAAGEALLIPPNGTTERVRATRLGAGPERDAVILATGRQQPFPGNLLYRAARRHVLAAGVYFRLDPMESAPTRDDGGPAIARDR